MKKIEAIVKTETVPEIKAQLEKFEIYSLTMQNLTSLNIVAKNGAVGRGGGIGEFLTKIELIVNDRDAKKVIDIITNICAKDKSNARIFVADLEEIVDISKTEVKDLKDCEDLNSFAKVQKVQYTDLNDLNSNYNDDDNRIIKEDYTNQAKRSRLVPLQKYTLMKVLRFYEMNKETLRAEYRIKSFSDFINFCVLRYLPLMESEIRHKTIENKSKLV